ncbi:MAG: hypothetical protein KIT25_17845 [Enhydrobacter sp.]|nr:MAG: hypothetical protein KIT25_17845 [Enhydrobacter sp.]
MEASVRPLSIVVVAMSGILVASGAWAQKDKDDRPGRGQGQGQSQTAPGQGGGPPASAGPSSAGPRRAASPGPQVDIVISDRDRGTTYSYYRREFAAGHCPPGLAKKNNGCLPPGQAKKMWSLGRPLPAGVVYYPLPGALLGLLSPAPAGHEYVRVANDILLMAVGTRMIVGALADLGAL